MAPRRHGPYDWRIGLLDKMSAPLNDTSVNALQWWADSEGMPAWENNPLATTKACCGGHPVNSYGVQAYPTPKDGVEATWLTLQESYYRAIVRAFRDGGSLEQIWTAINASPWCGGCQGGKYPIELYVHLGNPHGHRPPGPKPPPPPPKERVPANIHVAWGMIRHVTTVGKAREARTILALQDKMRRARR